MNMMNSPLAELHFHNNRLMVGSPHWSNKLKNLPNLSLFHNDTPLIYKFDQQHNLSNEKSPVDQSLRYRYNLKRLKKNKCWKKLVKQRQNQYSRSLLSGGMLKLQQMYTTRHHLHSLHILEWSV